MKKIVMILVTAGLMITGAQAQNADSAKAKKSPEDKARMLTERMDKQLELTDEQEAKILIINTGFARKKAELHTLAASDKKAVQEQMKSLRADADRQINEILTPAQQTKKKQLDQERKEKHGKHKNGTGHHKSDKDKSAK